MLERIKGALSRLGIDTWRVRLTDTDSAQLFFIRRGADMRRATRAKKANVTVFRDFAADGVPMRGSSAINVYPDMPDSRLESALSEAYAAAAHVKNPFFELPDACQGSSSPDPDAFAGETLESAARLMAEAMFSADTQSESFLNSSELFAQRSECRILASNGLDVRYETGSVSGEFVVQCLSPQDVELYRDFRYRGLNRDALCKEVADAIATARDRAKATEAPAGGTYDCVLSGKQLATLLSSYAEKADAGMVYAKYSQYAVGCDMQGADVAGEKLNIRLTSETPYSSEGIPTPGIELAREGKLLSLHGATRFCRYLGIRPVGGYEGISVSNGLKPMRELLAAPCIYPVAFSDFQADALAGRFGGEIRLAYVYDENGVRLATGGSVNGSLLEAQKDMAFSVERYEISEYEGPLAVRLKGVSVAGK